MRHKQGDLRIVEGKTQKHLPIGVILKIYFQNIRKIQRKTPVLETPC